MHPAVTIPSQLRAIRPSPDDAAQGVRTADAAARACNAAAAAGPAFACSVVGDRAGFDALEAEWSALFERAGRPTQAFQSFNWLWHWANHYLSASGGPRLAVVAVRREGRLVLVWPLVRERIAGLQCLSWMGAPVSQYGDVVVEDGAEDAIRAAWHYIVAELAPDLVRLRKVRADAAIAPFLAEIGASASERQQAPYVDLDSAPDFETYETRYPAKARKNRRRQMRRLEERGAVAFESHAHGTAARALAETGLTLKRAWLADRGLVSPALSDERMTRFIADAAEAASHPTGCRVAALKSAGETAAVEIAFACKGRLLVHVIVYDRAFDKAGAGNLLVEESLRQAKAAGIATFDLLAPGDAYKMDWADGAVAVDDFAVELSAAGRLYATVYLGFVRQRLKRVVAAMPATLRRLVASGYGMMLALY